MGWTAVSLYSEAPGWSYSRLVGSQFSGETARADFSDEVRLVAYGRMRTVLPVVGPAPRAALPRTENERLVPRSVPPSAPISPRVRRGSGARGQLRWIMHLPPAALRLPQNWLASPADANGPVTTR